MGAPKRSVLDASLALLAAEEEEKRIRSQLAKATEYRRWCKISLTMATLELRAEKLREDSAQVRPLRKAGG